MADPADSTDGATSDLESVSKPVAAASARLFAQGQLPPPPGTALPPPAPLVASDTPTTRTALQTPLQPPGAIITVVRNATELQEAVGGGAVDIEIRSHLDFRVLRAGPPPQPGEYASVSGAEFEVRQDEHLSGAAEERFLLFAVPPTRSIRVRSPLPKAFVLQD